MRIFGTLEDTSLTNMEAARPSLGCSGTCLSGTRSTTGGRVIMQVTGELDYVVVRFT